MHPHERIAVRRREKGLSETAVAQTAGISVNEYLDIEHHPDEILDTARLWQVKGICNALELDLLELLNINCAFCDEYLPFYEDYHLPRHKLVAKRRTDSELSVKGLGDRVGFFEEAIQSVEGDPLFLESWSVNLIGALASELKLPLQLLVGARCRNCGR